MQYWDNPFVIGIAFAIVVMLVAIMSFSVLGKMGKRTLRTYNKGRTISEKAIYMLATFGTLIILLIVVFGLAFLDFFTIPYWDVKFNLDFIVDNVYYVGIIIVIMVFVMSYVCISKHQKGTNMMAALMKEQKRERKD